MTKQPLILWTMTISWDSAENGEGDLIYSWSLLVTGSILWYGSLHIMQWCIAYHRVPTSNPYTPTYDLLLKVVLRKKNVKLHLMETMRIEKKTTHGYIIGVWRFITDGCFTGIKSWSPTHDTIKGFPWNWYLKGKLINQHRTTLAVMSM